MPVQPFPSGVYGRPPQHDYPTPVSPVPPGPIYPPAPRYSAGYPSPDPMPYGGAQGPVMGPPPVAAATPAAMPLPWPATPPQDAVIGPAPREWDISLPMRRLLLKISTGILFGILGLVGISYAVNLLSASSPPTVDTTPPTISNIDIASPTETSAIITWQTDEPATTQVMLCDPSDLCTWTTEEALVTDHSVTLTDLEPNTTYHLTIISEDADENENVSEEDFTTAAQADTTPPVISGVDVSDIIDVSATITWETGEPATSQVEHGTTAAYGSSTPLDEELTTHHSVTLTGLAPDTTHHFSVKSQDTSGNAVASATDQTFGTLPAILVGNEKDNRAPAFTLQTTDGHELTLSDFIGTVVMINFWATWCGPCVDEMPFIQAVFEEWPQEDLALLTINVSDTKAEAQSFLDAGGFTFPVLIDSGGRVAAEYDATTIPRTFFIDTRGIIQYVREGDFNSKEEIEYILESL